MRIAYILFEGITTLDFIGIYDPISRLKSLGFLPKLQWDICSTKKSIKDNFGLEISTPQIAPDLGTYDAIIIPGGFGTRNLQTNADFIEWLRTAKDVKYKISICTGSLLLGAAGFLQEKKGTTHFNEYENLGSYSVEVLKEQIVDDGDVITAGAVAAALELGLYLCEKWGGVDAREQIAKSMNYNSGK